MAMYSLAIAEASYLCPMIAGFISQYAGWQWVSYIPTIFLGVVFVFLLVMMEERNYLRQHAVTTNLEISASFSKDKASKILGGK